MGWGGAKREKKERGKRGQERIGKVERLVRASGRDLRETGKK